MAWTREQKSEYQRKWRRRNPEKWKATWQASNRKHNLQLYGVDHEDYDRMFIQQQGCCAICQRHQTMFKRRLAIDHNHATERVRALLCRAADYLERYQ